MKQNATQTAIAAAPARLIFVAQGEANGYDDSDGFRTYIDLDKKEVVTDFWTTRGYCTTPVRKPRDFWECTPEEQAECEQIAFDHLYDKLKLAYQARELSDSYPTGKFAGIPCKVDRGRKYKGEGKLVEIARREFYYGWHNRNCRVTHTAIIELPDGKTAEANADYLVLTADIKPVIRRYWQQLLNDEGYKSLPFGHYSRDPWLSDYILKYYRAQAAR